MEGRCPQWARAGTGRPAEGPPPCDLLFSARLRTGSPVLLYVLREHQSEVDPWMAWRMLRYVVRLLERWRQRHPKMHYLFQVGDRATREVTARVLHSVADARRAEELMKTVGEELIEQGFELGLAKGEAVGLAKGEAKGLATSVLRILKARGVSVDEASRQRILACTDLATLDAWHERALNATTLSDVLGELRQ